VKSSCVIHPAKDPLIIIHHWQVEFCGGDTCAAALMSYFEYWHNVRLDQREKAREQNDVAEDHGEPRTQDESLLQFQSERALEEGVMIYGARTIRDALKVLAKMGVIEVLDNPNRKYRFDRTKHYLFHPEICAKFLESYTPPKRKKLPHRNGKIAARCGKITPPDGKIAGTIPETTSETEYSETEEQGQVPLNWNTEEGNTTTEKEETSSGKNGPPRGGSGDKVFEVPGWVPAEQWMDFVKFRKDSGKAIRGETGARYAIRSLERLRESGNDPAEVLAQSIANGWIGLFAVKNGGNGNGKLTAGQQTAINAERVLERLRQREAAENPDGVE